MSWLSDSSPLVSGAWMSSLYPGHGILGAEIPGGSVFENDFDPGDEAKEFRAFWLTAPSSGTFTPFEDGGFTLSGAADGTYSASYELYVDGVDLGPATVSITISSLTVVGASLTTSYAVLNSAGADLTTSYGVMASAGASLVTSYGVLQSAGASLTTSYAVENDSGLTPVGVSLTTSYGVLNAAGASLTTSYEVEGSDDVSTDLIVEDGTGKADAESYASVAAADLYHSLRRNAVWATYGVAVKEAALRKATEWLDSEFSGLWQGWRSHATQALAWPRSGVVIDGVAVAYNALPAALTRATCELSLRAAIGPLTIDVGAQVTSKTVGPISVTYAHGARQQTKYAGVENLVSPLLKSGRGTVRLVRA